MNLSLINPYIRLTMESRISAGHNIARRVIYDYELIYLETGNFTFLYNDTTYRCKAGDIIFIRPGIPHSFILDLGEISQPHIHFDMIYTADSKKTPISFKDLPAMSPAEKALIRPDLFGDFPRTPFVFFENTEQALALFYRVIDCVCAGQALEAKGLLTTLLAVLIRDNFASCLNQKEPTWGIARQLKDFIDATHGVGIGLDALEKQFSYSKFHLERQFQREYGVSLIAYVNKKKMRLAQELLTEKSVSQVAEEIGFSSIYAFSRAFKNRFGISPSEYKKTIAEG